MQEERILKTHKIKSEKELEIIMELELDELLNELRLLYENNLELQEYSKNDEEIKEYVQDNNAIIVQKTRYVVDYQKELKDKFPKNRLTNVNIFEIFSIIDSKNKYKNNDNDDTDEKDEIKLSTKKDDNLIENDKKTIDNDLDDILKDIIKDKEEYMSNNKVNEIKNNKIINQGFIGCNDSEEIDILNSKSELITELEL